MTAVLRVAMGRVLQAAAQPQCRALIGPRTAGATVPGGARVPGTCFELTQDEAAADIATLLCWPQEPDAPARTLAQLLAQADAESRAAVLRGERPLTVGELMMQLQAAALPQTSWMGASAAAPEASAVAVLFDDEAQLVQLPVQRFVAALVRH